MGSSLIARYTGHRLPFLDDEKSDTPSEIYIYEYKQLYYKMGFKIRNLRGIFDQWTCK